MPKTGSRPNGHRPSLQIAPLLTFGRLAQEGSFTRTAEAMRLSQPAVSQHVRSLERHFGVRLVDLVGRQVVLTEAGQFLAERANQILEGVAAAEQDMRHYAGIQTGELRLGTTITIGGYTLTPLLRQFRATYPNVVIRVTMRNTRGIGELVKSGELELGLIEGSLLDEDLDITPYSGDELSLIVPIGHRFSRPRKAVELAALEDEPFVAREAGSGTRETVESALREAGVAPRVVIELPNGEAIVRAVESGVGVSIISSIITDGAVAAGRIARVPIAGVDFRRPFRVVRVKRHTPSPAANAFIAFALASGAY